MPELGRDLGSPEPLDTPEISELGRDLLSARSPFEIPETPEIPELGRDAGLEAPLLLERLESVRARFAAS